MATLFVDLDGTLVHFATNTPLTGAVEALSHCARAGDQIVFTTLRPYIDGEMNALLTRIAGGPPTVLCNLPSPRIVINDDGASAVNHPTNAPWSSDSLQRLQQLGCLRN